LWVFDRSSAAPYGADRTHVTCNDNMKKSTLKSGSGERETSDDVQSPYLVVVAIEDEMAAGVTAKAMGWVQLEDEDGAKVWFAQRMSVSMTLRSATRRSRWFAPTH
jgi:hypothetical protein